MNFKKIISGKLEGLTKNSFVQNIAIVAGGNLSAKVIGIAATPIITRIYTPDDYGLFSIFISIIGISGSLVTLRYAITIPIAKNEKLAENLIKLCFFITLSLSILWLLGIILFENTLIDKYNTVGLKPFLWLIPVVFFLKGIYETLNNWAVREKRFKLITRTKITQSISSAILKIGLGILHVTPAGLFIGHIGQETAGSTSILLRLRQAKPRFFKKISWSQLKEAAWRYRKFPLVQSWSQLLLALGAQLPIIYLGAFYNTEIVGVFGLAQNIINMPMSLLGQSVAQVYYAEISKLGTANPNKIYELSISIIKKMFWVGLVPIIGLVALGPWLFKTIFGAEWINAGIYAQLLSLLILTRFISSPLSGIFNLFEKQQIQLLLNILRVGAVSVVFIVGHLLQRNVLEVIGAYSLTITLYYALLTVTILRLIKGKINCTENDHDS